MLKERVVKAVSGYGSFSWSAACMFFYFACDIVYIPILFFFLCFHFYWSVFVLLLVGCILIENQYCRPDTAVLSRPHPLPITDCTRHAW